MDARVDVVVDVDYSAGNVLQQKVVLREQKNMDPGYLHRDVFLVLEILAT